MSDSTSCSANCAARTAVKASRQCPAWLRQELRAMRARPPRDAVRRRPRRRRPSPARPPAPALTAHAPRAAAVVNAGSASPGIPFGPDTTEHAICRSTTAATHDAGLATRQVNLLPGLVERRSEADEPPPAHTVALHGEHRRPRRLVAGQLGQRVQGVGQSRRLVEPPHAVKHTARESRRSAARQAPARVPTATGAAASSAAIVRSVFSRT